MFFVLFCFSLFKSYSLNLSIPKNVNHIASLVLAVVAFKQVIEILGFQYKHAKVVDFVVSVVD